MFGKSRMRLYIAVVWLICFITMYIIFDAVLPYEEFGTHLNKIEQSVAKKDWEEAKKVNG